MRTYVQPRSQDDDALPNDKRGRSDADLNTVSEDDNCDDDPVKRLKTSNGVAESRAVPDFGEADGVYLRGNDSGALLDGVANGDLKCIKRWCKTCPEPFCLHCDGYPREVCMLPEAGLMYPGTEHPMALQFYCRRCLETGECGEFDSCSPTAEARCERAVADLQLDPALNHGSNPFANSLKKLFMALFC